MHHATRLAISRGMNDYLILLPDDPASDWLNFLESVAEIDPHKVVLEPMDAIVIAFEEPEDTMAALLSARAPAEAFDDHGLLVSRRDVDRLVQVEGWIGTYRCYRLWCPDEALASAIMTAAYNYAP